MVTGMVNDYTQIRNERLKAKQSKCIGENDQREAIMGVQRTEDAIIGQPNLV